MRRRANKQPDLFEKLPKPIPPAAHRERKSVHAAVLVLRIYHGKTVYRQGEGLHLVDGKRQVRSAELVTMCTPTPGQLERVGYLQQGAARPDLEACANRQDDKQRP